MIFFFAFMKVAMYFTNKKIGPQSFYLIFLNSHSF